MEHGLVEEEGACAACEPAEDVETDEGCVPEETDDGWGHEVEGYAVDEDVGGSAVRECASEHRPAVLNCVN